MPSINDLVTQIRATRGLIEAIGTGIAASLSKTVELADRFRTLGAEDKIRQLEVIERGLETHQTQVSAAVQQVEAAQARAEALRSSDGGGHGAPPGPPPPAPVPAPRGWATAPDLAAARDHMDRLGEVPTMRRIHILDGDGDGISGGHRWDSAIPGKTKFPRTWNDDKIIEVISDVARNPDHPPEARMRGGWECVGVRNGVEILAVTNRDGSIWTGHPLKGPGVETNPR